MIIPYYLLAAGAIIFLDRVTKLYVLGHFRESVYINSLLSFQLSFNRGISWGLFNSQDTIAFFLVTLAIIVVLCWLLSNGYSRFKEGKLVWDHVLIASGAVSNLVDRFLYGGVVDFIVVSYQRFIWPSFNVADVAIVLGALLMLITVIKEQ